MPIPVTPGRRRRLRLLSIIIPLIGLAALYPLRAALLNVWSSLAADVAIGLLMLAGVVAFSVAIFRLIDRQDRVLAQHHFELARRYETERRLRAQLEALHAAATTIASERTPAQVLQRLVELARELIGARYAALGVLGPHDAIDGFYTAGITAEERARLGAPPQGHGLLGVLLSEGTSLNIADIAQDPRSVGFPPGHPPMRSLLGVPVAHGGQVVGNLYLADKEGAAAFSAEDERVLRLLGGHAAVVIVNARLAEQVRTLAIVAERDRIGKELHDGVIQALYAVTLELEGVSEDVEAAPHAARDGIEAAIERISAVITDLRRYILGLQPRQTSHDQTLPEALAALLAETHTQTLLETALHVEGDTAAARRLPAAVAQELGQIAREAVANVVRHAHASHLSVTLEAEATAVRLRIADDGAGFDTRAPLPQGHFGLRHMRERAAGLGGVLRVHARPGQGATVEVQVPLRVDVAGAPVAPPGAAGEELHV